jgi:hypothetical protein
MKDRSIPTLEQIEALTTFLPRLYAEGFSPVLRWESGREGNDGTYSLSYPTYHPTVEEFFRAVSSGGWLDHEYDPERAYQMLKDEALAQRASLDQIKSMLTFCVRGERFSDGHWEDMIQKGYIRRLLERLNKIAEEMR